MASRYWVGGTGTWDLSSTTNWSTSSGGASGASAPGSADAVIFDASSGGGTVTPNFGGSATFQSITCGAHTGTIDFSINNDSLTVTANSTSFSGSGSGVRTLKLGSGTFTCTGVNGTPWDFTTTTNLTFDAGTSTVKFSGTPSNNRTFAGGNVNYNKVQIASVPAGYGTSISMGSGTITTLQIDAPNNFVCNWGALVKVTNLVCNGSSTALIRMLSSSNSATSEIRVSGGASISWCAIGGIQFSGTASPVTATNSFDCGNNISATITGPSVGGGVSSNIPALGRGLH